MIPDLFHYFFTGIKVNEFTDASTSQMLDPATRAWAYRRSCRRSACPTDLLGTLVQPGTVLGPLRAVAWRPRPACRRCRSWRRRRTTPASAVAAVPARRRSWAYISSGTWSLMGVETDRAARRRRGAGGQLHQRGRRRRHGALPEEHHGPVAGAGVPPGLGARRARRYSYDELTRLAEAAPPFAAVVDPDDAVVHPAAEHARGAGRLLPAHAASRSPTASGATVRCALESLALRYRWVLERLEELTGQADRRDPHRRRRRPERAAVPAHGRRLRPAGAGRPGRGDGHRQRAGAGDRPGRCSARWRRRARWCGGRSR